MPVSSGIEFQEGSLWNVNVCTYWEVHTLLDKVHIAKISTRHDYLYSGEYFRCFLENYNFVGGTHWASFILKDLTGYVMP